MPWGMNIFRILADCTHLASKCILIFSIHINRSAEGVSLLTQALYVAVFGTRYLDLLWIPPSLNLWNFFFKIFYITSSIYIIFLMMRVYARTREREAAWKLAAACLGGSIVLAPIANLIMKGRPHGPVMMLKDFSLILESVAVLPQLLLLRQTSVPTVIDSFYLLALGSYRALYILNWIEREIDDYWKPDALSIIFGIVQTAFYVDFAWVYWTRQRVKLRYGGVVDADDLGRGWLLNKLFARPALSADTDEDEESAPALGPAGARNGLAHPAKSRWGKRGVSVRADDEVFATEEQRQRAERERERQRVELTSVEAEDAMLRDPDELAAGLDDDEDDDLPPAAASAPAGVGSGEEWRK